MFFRMPESMVLLLSQDAGSCQIAIVYKSWQQWQILSSGASYSMTTLSFIPAVQWQVFHWPWQLIQVLVIGHGCLKVLSINPGNENCVNEPWHHWKYISINSGTNEKLCQSTLAPLKIYFNHQWDQWKHCQSTLAPLKIYFIQQWY